MFGGGQATKRGEPGSARSRSSAPGVLAISLDFELYWGMRDVIALEAYRANLEGVHEVVPRILDLFARHEIHATWACVGLLFARDREEALSWAPKLRPTYERPELSPFGELELADLDRNPRCYFAPQLIREIAGRPDQELGTHTFSHYYCDEPGQTPEQFEADLEAAIGIAEAHGVRPRSLVFPRNQCNLDYLPVLRRRGIRSYRGLRRWWADERAHTRVGNTLRRALRLTDNYLRVSPDGHTRPEARSALVDIPGSRFLRPHSPALRHLDPLRLHRMREEMTRAAQTGSVYHLWWHPHNFGRHFEANLQMLDRLLSHAQRLRDTLGFRSLNMAELAAL
ncbi:MAG: polysaccharide deacetylase family protein [Enhygromyxa sp.]